MVGFVVKMIHQKKKKKKKTKTKGDYFITIVTYLSDDVFIFYYYRT